MIFPISNDITESLHESMHQLMEVLMLHKGMGKAEAFEESVRMLEAVKIPEARKRITMYPHEFSGGMRQRVMIALFCYVAQNY